MKVVAGVLTGSAAMLAEAAHSVADTTTEGLLLAALRGPNPRVGGLLVLGLSFVIEGASWIRAVLQIRREKADAGRTLLAHLRVSDDPTVQTVFYEDSAALIGLVLAFGGVGLHLLTGSAVWDGLASLLIGVLLAAVAYLLGRTNMGLLIGKHEIFLEPVPRSDARLRARVINRYAGTVPPDPEPTPRPDPVPPPPGPIHPEPNPLPGPPIEPPPPPQLDPSSRSWWTCAQWPAASPTRRSC